MSMIIIIVYFIQLSISNSYIIINFKNYNTNLSSKINLENPNEINNFLYNKYISFINIGNPKQKVEIDLFSRNYGLKMKEGCITNYTYYPKLSTSMIEMENSSAYSDEDDIRSDKQVKIKDNIELLIYNESEIEMINTNNIEIIYERLINNSTSLIDLNEKPCLHLGAFLRCPVTDYFCNNIINKLKNLKIINSYNINIIYYNKNKEYDGQIIIGSDENITKNNEIFKDKKLIEDFSSYNMKMNYFEIQFDEIYFNIDNNKIRGNNETKEKGQVIYDLNYIFSTKYYYEIIKEKYFNKYEKCYEKFLLGKYNMIMCDKNIKIDNFPTLYFYNNDYNYTFELTYKDLFLIDDNYIYFLIIYDDNNINNFWKIGKIFLQKYILNFNIDNKKVGLYKPNETIKINSIYDYSKILYIIIYIISLIIIGSIFYYLGKRCYKNLRKRRLNEMNDDDLLIDDDNNNNVIKNSKIEKTIN